MSNLLMLCVFLVQSLTVVNCHSTMLQNSQRNSRPLAELSRKRSLEWRPAVYRGITVGQSTRTDLLNIFGKPKWSELFDEDRSNPEVWYHYPGRGELPGELVVSLNKSNGIVLRMYLYLENSSKEDVIRYFGDDYVVTRYKFCKGFEDEDAAPIYEAPDGSITYLEYRDRGIAVAMGEDGKANHITFVSKPIGLSSSKCR